MRKFIHIVFGDSAAGSLKYFFSKAESGFNGRVFSLMEDFSIGPIYGFDTGQGYGSRMNWFKEMFAKVCASEYFEFMEKDLAKAYGEIKRFPEEAEIVIWHGKNTSDQVGLRCLCSLLEGRKLREADVSNFCVKAEKGIVKNIRAMGECSPDEIGKMIKGTKRIEEERRKFLAEEWKKIIESKKSFRILVKDRIEEAEESYFDQEIVLNCSLEFKRAARAIGGTMGHADQLVGDAFIDYRLRTLIESGRVQYRGRLETMRDFDVRLPVLDQD